MSLLLVAMPFVTSNNVLVTTVVASCYSKCRCRKSAIFDANVQESLTRIPKFNCSLAPGVHWPLPD